MIPVHQRNFSVPGAECTETRVPHLSGATIIVSCLDNAGVIAYPDPVQSASPLAPLTDAVGHLAP